MFKLPKILKHERGKKIILCFSVLVTGKCNRHCSYCHFFASRKRNEINFDISDELFDIYCKFISEIKKNLPKYIELQCRFSGGEPLVLDERIYELAKKMYQTNHIKPYILTNGSLINKKFIKLACKDHINLLYVSIENPLEPESGTCNPTLIMDKIKKFNSKKLPIIPAVVIIKNEHFKNLFKICKIFYKKLERLPTINELSYDFFVPPTKKQLKALYENVYKIVKYFTYKTPIKLFPYISPELCYGGNKHFILELDMNNKYKMTKANFKNKINSVFKQLYRNYPMLKCEKNNCDWAKECKNIKWVWKHGFGKLKITKKIKSYCEMKKVINQAYFDALKSFK